MLKLIITFSYLLILKMLEPNKVIYDFKKFVESFSLVSEMQDKIIYSFWYLPNQVFWKAILTTAAVEWGEDSNEFLELCKELRRLYYSYWIAGYITSKIKQLSFNLIKWIKNKGSLDYIRHEINEKMKEDKVIERVKESLEDEVYQYSWLKPLLALIEYEQHEDSKVIPFIDLDRNVHVDHILPIKWKEIDYWKKMWNEEKANHWLNRLGNLTLLSGKKNIKASNEDFEKKKKIYEGKGIDGITPFQITQMIIKKAEWTENEVKERDKWIKERIKKILRLPIDVEDKNNEN